MLSSYNKKNTERSHRPLPNERKSIIMDNKDILKDTKDILKENQSEFEEIKTDELDQIVGGSTYSQDGEWVINNNDPN